jgi:hypothetical protein
VIKVFLFADRNRMIRELISFQGGTAWQIVNHELCTQEGDYLAGWGGGGRMGGVDGK